MLHIILGILKTVGIIIAILLLILLSIILSVIFVPVRYRVQAVKQEEKLQAAVKVSWLLHLISVAATFGAGQKLQIVIRLFGIRLPFFGEKKQKQRRKKAKRGPKKRSSSQPQDQKHAEEFEVNEEANETDDITMFDENRDAEDAASLEEMQASDDITILKDANIIEDTSVSGESDNTTISNHAISDDTIILNHTVLDDMAVSEKSDNIETAGDTQKKECVAIEKEAGTAEKNTVSDDTEEEEEKIPDESENFDKESKITKFRFKIQSICDRIKKIFQMLARLLQTLLSIPEKISNVWDKVKRLLEKPQQLLDLIEEYEVKALAASLYGYLLSLLRHYKPRRIKGYLKFGTGDPASTGQLTGLVYLFLPATADQFTVIPEFNEAILETDITAVGHIRAFHLIRIAWKAFRDKRLRRLIRKFRNRD